MRVVKAAAVQLSPVLYSREGTVEKVVRKVHELGQQGVQFATFPETVVPYYPYFSSLCSKRRRGDRQMMKKRRTAPALSVPREALWQRQNSQ